MADIILSIDVDVAEAEAYFEYAGYHARDMRDPLKRVLDDVILAGIAENFETEGGRVGGWEPVSDPWLKYKMKHGYHLETLQQTGDMRRYMLGLDFPNEPWHITQESLDYQVHMDRAIYHQAGTGRMPMRRIVVVTPEDYDAIEDIFSRWLDDLRTKNARRGAANASIRPPGPQNIWVL